MEATQAEFRWMGKCTEMYYKDRCGGGDVYGMASETWGLLSNNAAVFTVTPTESKLNKKGIQEPSIKEDVIKYLDTHGLHTDDMRDKNSGPRSTLVDQVGCELGLLFRRAPYLLETLQRNTNKDAPNADAIFLLVFRELPAFVGKGGKGDLQNS